MSRPIRVQHCGAQPGKLLGNRALAARHAAEDADDSHSLVVSCQWSVVSGQWLAFGTNALTTDN
jgi:hypothetical protein